MTTEATLTLEHRLTHRDLDYTPQDGNLYEVIDGVLHVTPFPTPAHQNTVSMLLHRLMTHVLSLGLGKVFAPGLKVVLDEPSGVGPDLTFISTARMGRMREDGFYGAPDLIVEVLSSRPQIDRFVKFHKYAAAGVPHYWILDPVHRTLEAFRLAGNRYELATELGRRDVFRPELFPALSIDLAELWM